MKRLLIACGLLFFCVQIKAQLLTWTPDFPKDNDNIVITVDATKGNLGLNNYANTNDVYVHTGVITNLSANNTDWKYVRNFGFPANQVFNTAIPQLKATSLGGNKYSYSITNIRAFYGVPPGETILRIAILFRNGNGSLVQRNANSDDMYVPVYDNSLAVRFTVPLMQPLYRMLPEPITKSTGDFINVTGIANQSSSMKIYLNGNVVNSASNVQTISANPQLTVSGNNEIVIEADNASLVKKDTIKFFVSPGITIAPLPAGVAEGINYEPGNTSVVLVLFAPNKSRVAVIGEFPGNNWTEQTNYQMARTPDGNYWWIRITGLTPGVEYAYQYLVEGTLKVADPYTEKVLDPANDGGISPQVYPNLRSYPAGQSGIVSILQTAAPAYTWRNNSFTRPDKRNLVIYELLVRDFTAAHHWQVMIDTLSYLQRLGVNAVELLPVMEFEGNDSWGYNTSFSFAPDKYYGTKNKLKEFIDSCHSKQIAVILDVVPNHIYGQSPLAQLYWNASQNRPAANNPWLNQVQPHAFGFGLDFNHESAATKYYWKRVFDFWLREYRIDGYRFDFTKGLTQRVSTDDAQFSAYDQSRIDIIRSYVDTIWNYFPGSYVILEHLAAQNEEVALQNLGYLMWGGKRENQRYNEATMGFNVNNGSNFSSVVYNSGERGFTNPHLVGYMESHDEERLVYKNKAFGNNTNASYNVRLDSIAVRRMEAATSLFLTIPGPKMIWQFGERGYDISIFSCPDNSIPQPYGNESCKLNPKDPKWNYMQDTKRKRLFDINAALINLRKIRPALFLSSNFSYDLGPAVKFFKITDGSLSMLVVANFDVQSATATVTFQNAGTWYDYLTGATITSTGLPQAIPLAAGEYHVYLNQNLTNTVTTPVIDVPNSPADITISIYPNPIVAGSTIDIYLPQPTKVAASVWGVNGQKLADVHNGQMSAGRNLLPLGDKVKGLSAGLYILRIEAKNQTVSTKILLQ